jgi:hypothetical protein
MSLTCSVVIPRESGQPDLAALCINVAIWEKEVPFNPNMLVFREAKYTAVLGY